MYNAFTSDACKKSCADAYSADADWPALENPDPHDPQHFMTRAGAAALVLGGTVAIVSGPDRVETVVSYALNKPRQLRA